MHYECIQKGDGLAISLIHLKNHLRLENNFEEPFLEQVIKVASESIENYLGRSLLLKTWKCFAQATSGGNMMEVELCYPPLITIVSVTEVFQEDVRKPVKRYLLRPSAERPKLSVWAGAVEIIYKCGYGENYLAIPESLRHAITLIAGEMYEKRVDFQACLTPAIDFLLKPYRVMPCL